MAVPDTNNFSLQDVVDDINPTTDDLQSCVDDADSSGYDTRYYSPPATSLLEFRAYDFVSVIDPSVDSDFAASGGGIGYFEVDINFGTYTGYVGIECDSSVIPDRFSLEWNGNVVADSLFVGDGLSGMPTSAGTQYHNEIRALTTLDKFVWNDTFKSFIDSGQNVSANFTSADIADGSVTRPTTFNGSVGGQIGVYGGYPSSTANAANGEVLLLFNKTTASPNLVRLRIWGITSTGWNVKSVIYNAASSVRVETVGTGFSSYELVGRVLFSVPTITERGFVYKQGNTTNLTIGASGVTKIVAPGTGLGDFKELAFEFNPIYFRAYVIAGGNTYYADNILATSTSGSVPSVRTDAITYDPVVDEIEANGEVLFSSSPITERGFVYSSSNSLPTISDVKVQDSVASLGDMLVNIPYVPQPSNITLYIRAYATSSIGTGYGKAKDIILPST